MEHVQTQVDTCVLDFSMISKAEDPVVLRLRGGGGGGHACCQRTFCARYLPAEGTSPAVSLV